MRNHNIPLWIQEYCGRQVIKLAEVKDALVSPPIQIYTFAMESNQVDRASLTIVKSNISCSLSFSPWAQKCVPRGFVLWFLRRLRQGWVCGRQDLSLCALADSLPSADTHLQSQGFHTASLFPFLLCIWGFVQPLWYLRCFLNHVCRSY